MTILTQELNVPLKGAIAQKMFFRPLVIDSLMQDGIFRVMDKVVQKQDIPYAGVLKRILQPYKACKMDKKGTVNFVNRQIQTKKVGIEIAICEDNFWNLITEELLRITGGANIDKLSGSQLARIAMIVISNAIKLDINALAIYGNEESTSEFYSQVDGVFHQITAGVDNNEIAYSDSNSGSRLGSGEAEALLDDIIDRAPMELQGVRDDQKFIMMPKQIYNRLRRDLKEGTSGSGGFGEAFINGVRFDTYDGIPIRKYFNMQANANEAGLGPHHNLVIYTAANNLALATADFASLYGFKMWFSDDDNEMKARSAMNLGFNFVHEKLLSVAY